MKVTIDGTEIELDDDTVKASKGLFIRFLEKVETPCRKTGSMSLYYTLLIVAHMMTAQMLRTIDEPNLKKLLTKKTS